MAKIIIDTNANSMEWFRDIVSEIINSRNIILITTSHSLFLNEIKKNQKMLEIYQRLASINKAEVITSDRIETHLTYLKTHSSWTSCSACDDPCIFAMVYEKNVPYVFTSDRRIAACRRVLKMHVDNKYSRFVLITSKNNFNSKRHLINQ